MFAFDSPASHLALQLVHGKLMEDGYCIVSNLLPPATIGSLHHDLADRFERTPYCDGDFYGGRTKRFGSLLTRSQHTDALVRHPLILALADKVLGPYCDKFQLNLTQAVEIHPGALAQAQHRDQDMWGGPKGSMEYLINVIWPLTPFTAKNGATVVWPKSHRDQTNYFMPRSDAVAAEMQPGSALVFLGSTLHSGGANSSNIPRAGIIISYSLGWLKPFENQWLVYPPDVARTFPRELAELAGYSIHRPNLGNYEGQSPAILLDDQHEEFLPASDALRPEHRALLAQLMKSCQSELEAAE
jgi:hypothetical protein